MKINIIKIVFLINLLFVFGCATPNAAQFNLGIETRIGIISIVPEEFKTKRREITVFGNKLERHDISSWNLNAHFSNTINKLVRRYSLGTPIPINYDTKSLLKLDPERTPLLSSPFKLPPIHKQLVDIGETNALDKILVFRQMPYQPPSGTISSPIYQGLGWLTGSFTQNKGPIIYFGTVIHVFDVPKKKVEYSFVVKGNHTFGSATDIFCQATYLSSEQSFAAMSNSDVQRTISAVKNYGDYILNKSIANFVGVAADSSLIKSPDLIKSRLGVLETYCS